MQSCRIAANSPLLARHTEFASLHELTALDVMAVRLWLDKRVKMPTPSNVAVGFDDGVGATLFDLTVLQVRPIAPSLTLSGHAAHDPCCQGETDDAK